MNEDVINEAGSKTFGEDLNTAINDSMNIKIIFARNKEINGNIQRIAGGFSQITPDTNSAVIGINPGTAFYLDENENMLKASAGEVLVHELSGHVLPELKNINGNAISIENIIREEIGLPLRKEDPCHVCF